MSDRLDKSTHDRLAQHGPTLHEPLKPLRIGAVNYLNAKPLVYDLAKLLPTAELSYDYPSRLADSLAAADLDIALVPAIELAAHPEWSIVSDACIGCLGPVLSVKLLFYVPPAEVKQLALDEGSRSSAVLAQILLSELYGLHPELTTLPLGCEPDEFTSDAILVIGDRAIRSPQGEFVEVWDLGEQWCRWAELPFVFAMWVAGPGVRTETAEVALATARDRGCQNLQAIAQQQSVAMDLPQPVVEQYLCQNLHFRLGTQQRKGLELFYQTAAKLGPIHTIPQVTLDDCQIEH